MGRKGILTALCLVAALACAFFAGRLTGDGSAPGIEGTATPTAKPTATPTAMPKAEIREFSAALYDGDNIPYAYDPEGDDPSLPTQASVDSMINAKLAVAKRTMKDAYDEEAQRAKYLAQFSIYETSYAPTIDGYLVENSEIAVLIFPGGGYFRLGLTNEGASVARAFNKRGISAFVVKYRIAPCDYRAILSDGQRAVRYVRANAAEFGVDPDKIAVCGFSQGGHLALMICQHPEFEAEDPQYQKDAVDAVSGLPNACIGCYAVATLERGHTYEVGADIFTHGDERLNAVYSAENGVTGDMCPTFIWLNRNDLIVPPEGAFRLIQACAAQKVPYEFHVFAGGAHGCGLGTGMPCSAWMPMACKWLKNVL